MAPTRLTPYGPLGRRATRRKTAAGPTKVLVFMVENHSLDEMLTQMPWTAALADRYGYATDYQAMTHPSLPNYLAIAGGSTFGVADDADPSSHPISGPSVFGRALGVGDTARVYAESMTGTCSTTPAGEYAVKHNPWAYFVDERAACDRYDVPLEQLASDARAGRLPGAGLVIADMCHIAHDCPLATADEWLRTQVAPVLAGPDFRQGRLVVVITADEDDRSDSNRVLTVVASTGMPEHEVVSHAAHPPVPEPAVRRGRWLRPAARGRGCTLPGAGLPPRRHGRLTAAVVSVRCGPVP